MSTEHSKKREFRSVVSAADYGELERHYRFLPNAAANEESSISTHPQGDTWQERMVKRYHDHLYKDYVLADFSKAREKQLGLRWRTEHEVRIGKGSQSCGNKKCPSHVSSPVEGDANNTQQNDISEYLRLPPPETEQEECERLKCVAHGVHLSNFEVPFSYNEHAIQKIELVKLCLCLRCAPLLFISKGENFPSLAARSAGNQQASLPGKQSTLKHESARGSEHKDDSRESKTVRHTSKRRRLRQSRLKKGG
jgi:hypothetical protein